MKHTNVYDALVHRSVLTLSKRLVLEFQEA